ncbi:MAG: protein-export chaperone SecB [Pseudomonadota bacterium]
MTNNENSRPHISINAQYIKDLSFENPGAPGSLGTDKGSPQVDLALDLHVTRLEDSNVFEVALHIDAKALIQGKPLFIVELLYAGVFTLMNFDEEDQKAILAVHCPAMIFPFARKIIADVTQDGGFQPLMIDPIDFGALFQRKMEEENEEREKGN